MKWKLSFIAILITLTSSVSSQSIQKSSQLVSLLEKAKKEKDSLHFKAAVDYYEKALKIDSNQASIWFDLSFCALKTNCKYFIKGYVVKPGMYDLCTINKIDNKQYNLKSYYAIQKALKLDSDNAEYLILKSHLEKSLELYTNLIKTYNKLIELNNSYEYLLIYDLATLYALVGDAKQAINVLENFESKHKQNPNKEVYDPEKLLLKKVEIYNHFKNNTKAIETLENFISQNKNISSTTYIILSEFYLQLGEKDKSKNVLITSLKNGNSENYNVKIQLSYIFLKENNLDESINYLHQAAIEFPVNTFHKSETILAYLSKLNIELISQKSKDRLIETIDEFRKFKLNNHSTSYLRANFYYIAGNLDSAKYELLKAYELAKYKEYLYSLGLIEFQLNNFDLAIEYLNKYLTANEKNAQVLELLGDLYHKKSDDEKAKKYWKEALIIDENNKSLREKLKQ